MSGAGDPRFDAAIAAIDAVNALDPVHLVVGGEERPKELVHADEVERHVRELDPAASDAQILAARAHHLRRWALPRSDYPDGRSGYLRWRTEQKRRHAAEVGEILASCGYDAETVDRVAAIVAKRGLGSDPAVQTHEDALCLTFLSLQFDDLIEQLDHDRILDVVRKTAAKMSPAGIAAVAAIGLSDMARAVLGEALAEPSAG